MSKQRLIDGQVRRNVNMRRPVVAVDAIHAASWQPWQSDPCSGFESLA